LREANAERILRRRGTVGPEPRGDSAAAGTRAGERRLCQERAAVSVPALRRRTVPRGARERAQGIGAGVEVFGRKPGYDPKLDGIVRTEAIRLRARLEKYYADDGSRDPVVVIELPKGGYRPTLCTRPSCENDRGRPSVVERTEPPAVLSATHARAGRPEVVDCGHRCSRPACGDSRLGGHSSASAASETELIRTPGH
jgi:hypothetical protein